MYVMTLQRLPKTAGGFYIYVGTLELKWRGEKICGIQVPTDDNDYNILYVMILQ